jgi:hypothetical protein
MLTEFRNQLLRFLATDKRALFNAGAIQGEAVSTTKPADGEVLAWSDAENKYVPAAAGGGGGAPTTADYVVKTANAGLSAERVLTDSASVTWSWATPGQVSATAVSSWTEAEVDFGSTPKYDATFTVTDAAVSGTSKVTVIPCGKAATGRTADDWQWDGIVFAANPAAGSFTLYATAQPGPVVGKRKIQYQVAA